MFNLAVKDSFNFAKKNPLLFILLDFLVIIFFYFNYGFEFKEMSVRDFIKLPGLLFFGYLIIGSIFSAIFFVSFSLFKQYKKITLENLLNEYKQKAAPIITACLWLILLLLAISLIAELLSFLNLWEIEAKNYEIYQYFVINQGILSVFVGGYIFFYLVFKFYFGGIFAYLNKDIMVIDSLYQSFQKISYKEISKIIIAFLSFLFVIGCIGRFATVIVEFFMAKQSIEFFKLDEFNSYGFIFLFVHSAIGILTVTFLTSYGWQLYKKHIDKKD